MFHIKENYLGLLELNLLNTFKNQINKSETKFSIKNSIILDDKITVEKKESKFLVKIPPYRWIYNQKVNKIKQPNDTLFLQIIKNHFGIN